MSNINDNSSPNKDDKIITFAITENTLELKVPGSTTSQFLSQSVLEGLVETIEKKKAETKESNTKDEEDKPSEESKVKADGSKPTVNTCDDVAIADDYTFVPTPTPAGIRNLFEAFCLLESRAGMMNSLCDYYRQKPKTTTVEDMEDFMKVLETDVFHIHKLTGDLGKALMKEFGSFDFEKYGVPSPSSTVRESIDGPDKYNN
jgi:hypothetical protein